MSAEHTPGPWRVTSVMLGHAGDIYVPTAKYIPDCHHIARCFAPQPVRPVNCELQAIGVERDAIAIIEANACLIAAAPELLGALISAREIISDIDEYQRRPGSGDYGVECACCMGELLDEERAAIARIDAAIAKAEGRS